MKKRTITSIFIVLAVALVVASKFLPYNIGDYIFDTFIIFIAIVAGFEMCHIMENTGRKVNKYLTSMYSIFNLIILLICLSAVDYVFIPLIQIASLVVYFLIILIVEAIRNRNKLSFLDSTKISWNSILACIYPGLLISSMLYINHVDIYAGIGGFSIAFLIMIFAITMLTDTFAYLIGSLIKGPKLAPSISPGKTISGAIGGLIGGIAGAMIMYVIIYNVDSWSAILNMYSLSWWHFLIIGLIGSILGQAGDLFESKTKRMAGIKDSGKIMPGHGGMLDRVDAMMFASTFIYIVTMIIVG